MGAVSVAEIQENASDIATALQLDPAERAALGLEKIGGLAAWLQSIGLAGKQADVEAWCEEMGAVSVAEIQENAGDIATALGLSSAESAALGVEKVTGLAAWLQGAGLAARLSAVEGWCDEMGAASVAEVEE